VLISFEVFSPLTEESYMLAAGACVANSGN
jgi:hypothetical protein